MVKHAQYGALVLFLVASAVAAGGELNDGMRLFFEGKYQQSLQSLTQQINQGSLDARVHYFRGLANGRTGKVAAAQADFKQAAMLELNGGGYGVGEALQRVQGGERLMLEKYRTMARLARRHRQQPVAPRPVVSSLSLTEPSTTMAPQVETAVSPTSVPRFRLASEVPFRSQLSDPFSSQPASSLLTSETKPGKPSLVPDASDEDPVGTGVVQTSGTEEIAATDDDDPFADDGDMFADSSAAEDDSFLLDAEDSASSAAKPKSGRGVGSGLFGALRAIGKSVIPQIDPSAIRPPGMPGGAPGGDRGAPSENPFE